MAEVTLAYATMRAKLRRVDDQATHLITRHAVDLTSYHCGALDTLCGRQAAVPLGEWSPGHSDNCQTCAGLVVHEVTVAS